MHPKLSKIVKCRRRSFLLEVKGGEIVARVPQRATRAEIEAFIDKHSEWIDRHAPKYPVRKLTEGEKEALKARAKAVIPERVSHYSRLVGVEYGRVSIRLQKTRWGSCSREGNLNFNALLMLAPVEVLDSVIVHELCHRLEMNHSERFYREVYRAMPDYDNRHKWLKDNGTDLMALLD